MSNHQLHDVMPYIYGFFDDFPALVLLLCHNTRKFIYANTKCDQLFHRNVVGELCFDLLGKGEKCCGFCRQRDNTEENVLEFEMECRWFLFTETKALYIDGELHRLLIGFDITGGKLAEAELINRVARDNLTGVLNRQGGMELIRSNIESLRMGKQEVFSVCYFDLIGMRQINHHYGNESGDRYIKQAARIVQSSIRQSDGFARMGEDKFMLLLSGCSENMAGDIMDNIIRRIEVYNAGSRLPYKYGIRYAIEEVGGSSFLNDTVILAEAEDKLNAIKARG